MINLRPVLLILIEPFVLARGCFDDGQEPSLGIRWAPRGPIRLICKTWPWKSSTLGAMQTPNNRRFPVPSLKTETYGTSGRCSATFCYFSGFLGHRLWGSGRRGTLPKGGGRSPPPFGRVSRPPGAAQTPKVDDFRPAPKSRHMKKRR